MNDARVTFCTSSVDATEKCPMKPTALLVFATFACGGAQPPKSPAPSDEKADRLEADFAGPSGLMQFFDSNSDRAIAAALDAHDIGFARNDEALSACEPVFEEGVRETWHAFDGEFYYIEEHGRPSRAYKYLPPVVAADRIESCQGNVGRWGDAEGDGNDYDGGHMIGSQLGGYGGRVNLVPQDSNFNRGNWLQVEKKAADCLALPEARIFYSVRADYGDDTSLVPTTLSLALENRDTGASVSFTFQNDDGGGLDGTAERNQAVEFLTAQDCE